MNSMEVRWGPAAPERMTYVNNLAIRRLAAAAAQGGVLPPEWTRGPAFELHIMSGLAELLADTECRMALRHIVACGERARIVVWLHGPLEQATAALAACSTGLAAALVEGRSLRHVSMLRQVRS